MKLYGAVGAVLLLVAVTVAALALGDDDQHQAATALITDDSGDGVNLFASGESAPSAGSNGDVPLRSDARSGSVSTLPSPGPAGQITSSGASSADGATPAGDTDDATAPGPPKPSADGSPDAGGSTAPGSTPSPGASAAPGSNSAPGGTPGPNGSPDPAGSTAPATPGAPTAPVAPGAAKPAASVFEPLRNAKAEFSRFTNVASVDLPMGQLTAGSFGSPAPNPISGQFRMHCEYSHFAYDDPIVFPGAPGQSHLHMFFGNTLTNAASTSDSLFDRGGGSCNGYELDRSAYWVPALMNGTSQTLVPTEILLYFKTNHPTTVQTFPKGLRVIAGASPSDPSGASHYRWKCENSIGRPAGTFEPINDGPFFDTIPDCRALGYETLGYILDFPYCWDGKNLDSADHRSHMSYRCSASHPVVFPQLQYIIHYPAPASNAGVHLASDSLECQTGVVRSCGDTLHGDWWNAWHEQTNQTWINECSRKRVVCGVPNISASTRLQGPPLYTGPTTLNLPPDSYVPGRD
ncbi:MAG: DUF1996 domain-containing protein [Actinomycetota bacterium]